MKRTVRFDAPAQTLDWYLDHLDGVEKVKGKDNEYWALCPCHADHNPSLHITVEDKILMHCQTCKVSLPDVRHALEGRPNGKVPEGTARRRVQSAEGKIVAEYDYVDEKGKALFQVVRYEPKDFKQRRKSGGRWVYNLKGVRRVLFRLPEVIEAAANGATIYVCEGEKDVESVEHAGAIATCNPGGAGKWSDEYSEHLRGAHVIVIADEDAPGRSHARAVARSLIGVASSVRVTRALTGKDAADHLEAGHTLDELVAADRFIPVDLGQVMEDGIEPPAFLVEGVLYAERAHAIAGAPGDGKTLLQLALCAELIEQGETVAWFDEENGPTVIASRLASFGVTAGQVSKQFVYFPFSEPTMEDADDLVAEMSVLQPALVVFDSGADMYVAAALNENDNMDMTLWALAFSQRLSRKHGIASVVLEHVTKANDGSYQRGASAKKAKVDALWMLEVRSPYDYETVGEVELVRAKDRLAHLPPKLRFRIGGNGEGKTTFEQVEVEDVEQERKVVAKQKEDAFRDEAVTALHRAGAYSAEEGLSQNQLVALLSPATNKFKNEVVQALAHDPRTPVHISPGPRNSLIYWIEKGESDD